MDLIDRARQRLQNAENEAFELRQELGEIISRYGHLDGQ